VPFSLLVNSAPSVQLVLSTPVQTAFKARYVLGQYNSFCIPLGALPASTDFIGSLFCYNNAGCSLSGTSAVALGVVDVTQGFSQRYTLQSGERKVFRAYNNAADPALHRAVATFDVITSSLSNGYFQLVPPGTVSSSSTSIQSSTLEACKFVNNYLWAVANVVNGPLNISVGLESIGSVPSVNVPFLSTTQDWLL
jgi:hypothetical protein